MFVRMEQLRSYWTDIHGIWYMIVFRKNCPEYSITDTLHEDLSRCMICHSILFRTRSLWNKICTDSRNTHFIFNNFFFPPENRAVYEIMCKNVVQLHRPEMTISRLPFKCWITKTTDKHSRIFDTYWFSVATVVKRKRRNVTFLHCLSCVWCLLVCLNFFLFPPLFRICIFICYQLLIFKSRFAFVFCMFLLVCSFLCFVIDSGPVTVTFYTTLSWLQG